MNKNLLIISFFLVTFINSSLFSQEVLQFRGENCKGMYPDKNLLKSWPEKGPNVIWEAKNLGNGYGSPAITSNRIYVNGEFDTITYLIAMDLKGNHIWKSPIGEEWVRSYPGARTTPTIVGDYIYTTAGMGTVACFKADNGEKIWSTNHLKKLNGAITRFGYAESIMVDEDQVFCMPGGKDTNVVALNRFTGEINWICSGDSTYPGFCTPLILKIKDRKILITFSRSNLLGIDAKTGKLLWKHKQQGEGDVHVNTPLYENGYLYYVAGNGNGAVKLKLSENGTKIEEVWSNIRCDNIMGGFIKRNKYIYTASYGTRHWYTLDIDNGKIVDSVKFDKGVTIYADDMLYLYNERGKMALFNINGPKMTKISEFRVKLGTKAHYSHPVINKGIMYLRRGNSLMAFDLKQKS